MPASSGGGGGPSDAAKLVDSLKSSAEQEFQIAERLSTKSRHAFALAAAVFTIAQTVAFGNFEADRLSTADKRAMIACAIASVLALAVAV